MKPSRIGSALRPSRTERESVDRSTRSFTLPAGMQRAALRFAADYCDARITINDQTVLSIEPYCPTQNLDVTSAVRNGPNQIAVEVHPSKRLVEGVALSFNSPRSQVTDEIAPLGNFRRRLVVRRKVRTDELGESGIRRRENAPCREPRSSSAGALGRRSTRCRGIAAGELRTVAASDRRRQRAHAEVLHAAGF